MALNKIGDENLYIGGFVALNNKLALEKANITHVISVLRMSPTEERFGAFKRHLHIPVDDVDDENLLEYFPEANAFIQDGLDTGGGVLVHCAMGKSRSATICIAYMLNRQPSTLNAEKALELIRNERPLCEPNDGFMEQLRTYHRMGCPKNVVGHQLYQRWLYQRKVEESVACGRGPDLDEIHFEDETVAADAPAANETGTHNDTDTEIRCRKCRRHLATSPFIIPHTPKQKPRKYQKAPQAYSATASCAHIFLHPLTWMRPSLFPVPYTDDNPNTPPSALDDSEPSSESPLSGRLSCPGPTCGANLGKFAWQGMQCSCGTWVVPAIALARARVDEVNASVRSGGAIGQGKAGIRMPLRTRGEQGDSPGGGEKGVL